ncbi:hypothetical protein H072_9116 [Dactylellina haptotyla CBS 200.50]|uniref:Vacuolar calcium ion transporter n=1 Tax=Dactylellina haptotyla (strain CBS 200.50) TaxID=1284197 RepID=S8BPR2_DACHA|nr:hypothetical protein H072_9116 [Dactylellina haptotyla CBS 200.50]
MSNSTELRDMQGRNESWQTRDGQYEYASNYQGAGGFPLSDAEESSTYYRSGSKQDFEDHERRLSEGLPPPPYWFNPWTAAHIALKSSSRLSSYSNVLFPAVPAGIVLWYTLREQHPRLVFAFNFIGIVPAGNLLAFASGELGHKLPPTLASYLEVLTGAFVEIIITMILLFERQFSVVRDALLGSMLANLLLVTGMCFFAGGLKHREQEVAEYVAELSNAALLISAAGLVLPGVFFQSLDSRLDVTTDRVDRRFLQVSRVVSFWLLISYICFVVFQLKTHHSAFHQIIEKAESQNHHKHQKHQYRKKLSVLEAIIVMLIGLTLVTFCAYFMVQIIPNIVEKQNVSELFLGLILVPVIEKAAEHLTTLSQAINNQQTLAISNCLGGTVQTALLVTPLVVLVGWAANRDMDLNFEFFVVFSLLLAVLIVGNFLRDGKTHWLEGLFLLMVYLVIATAAYNYPNREELSVDATETPPTVRETTPRL